MRKPQPKIKKKPTRRKKESVVLVSESTPTSSVPKLPSINFKHMANPGDVIAALAPIKRYHELSGRKVNFCQVIGAAGNYYPGANHPTRNKEGDMVTMNDAMFEMTKPLVEYQDYIASFEKFEGQPIHVNLDVIRGKIDVGMPHGALSAWIMYAFPDLSLELSKPWLSIPDEPNHPIVEHTRGKVIVNLTERYRSHGHIEYSFLKRYAPDLVFAGTEREHLLFCNANAVNIPRLNVSNFLELAIGMKYARFTLGNQSMIWNIANAAGLPRLLEVCKHAHNCNPFYGENNYGYMFQEGAEYLFRKMYTEL